MSAQHPSRSAPKCVDCRHCTADGMCNHPDAPADKQSGRPLALAVTPRKQQPWCGRDAPLFTCRNEPAFQDGGGEPVLFLIPPGTVHASNAVAFSNLADAPAGSYCLVFTTPEGPLWVVASADVVQRLRQDLCPAYAGRTTSQSDGE